KDRAAQWLRKAEGVFCDSVRAQSDLPGGPSRAVDLCAGIAWDVDQTVAAWTKAGRPEQAAAARRHEAALLDRALALDPDNAAVLCGRATMYIRSGRWEEAVADSARAVERSPDLWQSWLCRGQALEGRQDWDQARAALSRAIELNPRRADAWFNRAQIDVRLGRLDEGLAGLTMATELAPGNFWFWLRRGQAYARLQQWDKTVVDCTRSLELKAGFAEPWQTRGDAYAALGQWDKAL